MVFVTEDPPATSSPSRDVRELTFIVRHFREGRSPISSSERLLLDEQEGPVPTAFAGPEWSSGRCGETSQGLAVRGTWDVG